MNDQTTSGLEIADPVTGRFATPQAQPVPQPAEQPVIEPPVAHMPMDRVSPPSAEEMALGTIGLSDASTINAGTSEIKPAAAAGKPRKVVRFVESEREKVVPLAHPVECEGFVYERIVVRRLNVSDYVGHFAKPAEDRGRFPCFYDARGEAIPDEVVEALSLDDTDLVNEAYQHFLPATFRGDPAP